MLELALRYDVPMAAIQLQNQMGASTALLAGQELSIPPAAEWEGRSPFWVVHEVLEGETMLAIAEDYVLDLDTLITVNGIPDSNWLTIGQPLIIPLDVPVEALAQLAANPEPVADVPVVEEAAAEAPVAEEPVAEAPAATAEPDLSAILAAVPASGDA
jgi:LysM repeat protein